MPYTINFLRGAEIVGATPWGDDLVSAKAHAADDFHVYKRQRDATAAVVIDDDQEMTVFTFPNGDGEAPELIEAAIGNGRE
jgi:hypothetical protein